MKTSAPRAIAPFHALLVALGTVILLQTPALAQSPALAWYARYNSDAARMDYPAAIEVGPGGLYVGGSTYSHDSNEDYRLLRYSRNGELLWSRSYAGAGSSRDAISEMALLSNRNLVVTGLTFGTAGRTITTLCYDSDGTLLWEHKADAPGFFYFEFNPVLAIGPDDTVHVAAARDEEMFALALNADGTERWTRTLPITNGYDHATDIAVDDFGDVYLAGIVGGFAGGSIVVKLDDQGTPRWQHHEPGPIGSVLDRAYLDLAPDGDVVCAATPESACGVFQVLTVRLSPDGQPRWTRAFPPNPCDSAGPAGLAVDHEGNTLVLCDSFIQGEGTFSNYSTIKYSPTGEELWRAVLEGPSQGTELPIAIAVDDAGNAYVTGATGSSLSDAMTASYSPQGQLLWSEVFDSGAPNDRPAGMVLGPRGEVYIVTSGFFPDTADDFLTLKYHPRLRAANPRR